MQGLDVRQKMKTSSSQSLFIAAACILISCGGKSVDLPNGYSLNDHGKILLQDPKGSQLIKDQISQFMVSGPHVYGWVDNKRGEYFALDTKSGRFSLFPTWKELEIHTDKMSVPRLSMKDSYTYWDIRSGSKHWKIQKAEP